MNHIPEPCIIAELYESQRAWIQSSVYENSVHDSKKLSTQIENPKESGTNMQRMQHVELVRPSVVAWHLMMQTLFQEVVPNQNPKTWSLFV